MSNYHFGRHLVVISVAVSAAGIRTIRDRKGFGLVCAAAVLPWFQNTMVLCPEHAGLGGLWIITATLSPGVPYWRLVPYQVPIPSCANECLYLSLSFFLPSLPPSSSRADPVAGWDITHEVEHTRCGCMVQSCCVDGLFVFLHRLKLDHDSRKDGTLDASQSAWTSLYLLHANLMLGTSGGKLYQPDHPFLSYPIQQFH